MTQPPPSRLLHPHTVTFDCWATLLYQEHGTQGHEARVRMLEALLGVDAELLRVALRSAWRVHQQSWHHRRVFGASHMIDHVLRAVGHESTPEVVSALVEALEPIALTQDVRLVPGARAALLALAARGVRRGLICDTGFSSGRVVRQFLARHGLDDLLEVTIFSDEVGVPKPHAAAFKAALDGLGVAASGAVHVGDLKRSDIAGAQAYGMGSVRLAAHHDDCGQGAGAGVIDCLAAGCDPPCERPEADAVARSYPELLSLLGYAD